MQRRDKSNDLGARAAVRRFGGMAGADRAPAAGMGSGGQGPGEPQEERPDLVVRVAMASRPGALTALDVAVENCSGRDVLLYLPLGQYGGGVWQPAPGRYECLADGETGVEISWAAHAVPAGVRVQCPFVPFMTLLRADERHVIGAFLPTPLSLRWAYRQCAVIKSGEAGSAAPTEVRSLRVALGYAWAPPGLGSAAPSPAEAEADGAAAAEDGFGPLDADRLWRGRQGSPVWPVDGERPELFQASYEWAVANQRIVRTEPIAARLQRIG